MKNKSKLKWGKLRRLYNIVLHDEKLQNFIIVFSCFGLMVVITLYVILFG